MKNNNAVLPLLSYIKKVSAYGISSYDFISGGMGSGDVNEAYSVSLVEGLRNAGYLLNAQLKEQYEKYIAAENEKNKPYPNNRLAAFMPKVCPAEFIPSPDMLAQQAKV